ncbi:MAG: hypothetical protein ACOCQA_02530 [bacterium]
MNIKELSQLEIKSNPNLNSQEKETTCIINDEGLRVHSDHRTGIKWCVRQLQENRAELNHYVIVDNCLTGISIKTDITLVSFKSKPRQQGNISNCFSIGG